MFEETLKFYQNFPKEGINFVDIMPFMQDKEVFTKLIGEIGRHVTAPTVAAPEARAFLFCAPLLTSDSGVTNVVPFRKKGKLPHSGDDLQSIEIMKEYGVKVTEFIFLAELDGLYGRNRLEKIAPVYSIAHIK